MDNETLSSIILNLILLATGVYFVSQGTNWEFGVGLGALFLFLKK